jgi:NTE family protein
MTSSELVGVEMFNGLAPRELDEIAELFVPRHFRTDEYICRQGDAGSSLFLIRRGVAQVLAESAGEPMPLTLLRRGDVLGEMSLLTNEPRSASVLASGPTDVLELGQAAFFSMIARHPAILRNLNRILSRRLAQTNRIHARDRHPGEAVALVVSAATAGLVPDVVESTVRATSRGVAALSFLGSAGHVAPDPLDMLGPLDRLLAAHGTVLLVARDDDTALGTLVDHADRTVVLCASHEAPALHARLAGSESRGELFVVGGDARIAGDGAGWTGGPLSGRDGIGWLGRHLARTKLGLALGAGGAKGYAHIGALQALEEAGYSVDCLAGSSIGAVVGACFALGMDPHQVERAVRRVFTPEMQAAMFRFSFAGGSAGLDVMSRAWHDLVGDRGFEDLSIPLVVMTVDLEFGRPAPIARGSLREALMAATALAGFVPPYQQGDQRLVDGVALVPVPTEAVIEAGADITISINLLGRQTLTAWPGESAPARESHDRRPRVLDAMMEVMELAQQESSARHAAKADVVVEPRFGPSTWRDFHLADRFLAAGRAEMEIQLEALQSLARPPSGTTTKEGYVVGHI